jgi:hypothetical protein
VARNPIESQPTEITQPILSQTLKVLVVFLIMGPPVGALTFFVGVGINGVIETGNVADVALPTMFGLIYGVPLCYSIGTTPTAISGLILGATAALNRAPGLLFAATVGIAVGIGMAFYAIGGSIELPSAETASGYIFSVSLFAACLVSTVICWIVAHSIIGKPAATRNTITALVNSVKRLLR